MFKSRTGDRGLNLFRSIYLCCYVLGLALGMFSVTASAGPTLPIYVINDTQSEWRDFDVWLFVDETRQASLESVIQQADAGFKSHSRLKIDKLAHYWLGWSVENTSDQTQRRLVGFDESFAKRVDLYEQQADDWLVRHSGIDIPVSQRQLQTELPVFEVELAPGERKTFYLMLDIASAPANIGTYLVQRSRFVNEQRLLLIFHVAVIGAFLALLIYNLFLSFALNDRLYLYYSGYVGFFLLFLAAFTGLDLLAGISGDWHHRLFAISGLGTAFLIVFSRELLVIAQYHPRVNRVLMLMALAFVLASMLATYDIQYYQFLVFLTPPTLLLLLVLAFDALRRGVVLAKYYLTGMSWYLIGMSMLSFLSLGVVDYHPLIRHAFVPAALLEVLIFSFALAYRIRLLEQDKRYFQQRLMDQQLSERKRLESLVEERTEELSKVNQQLVYLSERDALTGLYNRRYLDQALREAWKQAFEKSKSLCLVMIDIDYFKSYNDLLGHQAGDRCLQKVAEVFTDCCADSGHLVARYGGEEFVILVANGGVDEAQRTLACIRHQLATTKSIAHPSEASSLVTISAGIACVLPQHDVTDEIYHWLGKADEALYTSKSNGRNTVTLYPSD